MGPEPVPAVVWKELVFELSAVICDVYDSSMKEGYLPVALKECIVHPVSKCQVKTYNISGSAVNPLTTL